MTIENAVTAESLSGLARLANEMVAQYTGPPPMVDPAAVAGALTEALQSSARSLANKETRMS